MNCEEESLIQKLAEELGIRLDQENRMHCTLRWPSRLVGVTLEGDQLMYALLLKRDLEYWKWVCRDRRWIPCSERMPEEGIEVLGLFAEEGKHIVLVYDKSILGNTYIWWNVELSSWQQDPPTHWMPILGGPGL